MGKRITRIFNEQLEASFQEILNQKISVILKNDQTFHGFLTQYDQNLLTLKLRANKFARIIKKEIQEIQIDKITDW